MRLVSSAVLAFACGALAACRQSPIDTGTSADQDLSPFYTSPQLCSDGEGPDCTRLTLGDPDLTTTSPARGKLFSCAAGNPNAPGSNESKLTWIDQTSGTWNLLIKPFLPAGGFSPGPGTASITESATDRTIVVSDLPVDARIGDWPMTQYPALSAIDPNPGVPAAKTFSFTLPLDPVVNAQPTCVSLGAIGVTLNGVVIYDAADARGDDAVAHEIVDVYGGHPAVSEYHYHFVPERLDAEPLPDGHSGLIGYIRDGFPLYGYRGVGGAKLTNADLDECHGHSHGQLGYHYHATMEYPYTIGCYRGTPR